MIIGQVFFPSGDIREGTALIATVQILELIQKKAVVQFMDPALTKTPYRNRAPANASTNTSYQAKSPIRPIKSLGNRTQDTVR